MAQADFTITVTHPRHNSDASILAKVAAVDLAPEFQFPGINLSIINDLTVILGVGIIQRTFTLMFTAEFIADHTTAAAQQAALEGLTFGSLRTQIPAYNVAVVIVVS